MKICVRVPLQLRKAYSLCEMKLFPRAGRPTWIGYRAGVRLRLRLRLRLRVRAGVRLRLRLRLRLRARAGVRPTIARMSLAESAVSEARVAIFARIASLVSILEELAALL